jgi:hypothetical protein
LGFSAANKAELGVRPTSSADASRERREKIVMGNLHALARFAFPSETGD